MRVFVEGIRGSLDDLQREYKTDPGAGGDTAWMDVLALIREVKRLRSALEEIIWNESRSDYQSIYAAPGEFAAIARDALDGKKGARENIRRLRQISQKLEDM